MNTFSKLGGAALAVALGITGTTLAAGPADAAKPTRIKGTVTSESGTPLAGIKVTTLADVNGEWVAVDDALTDDLGKYNVGKLDDGSYLVRFDDPAGTYAPEFYDDAATAETATPVELAVGDMPTLAVARLAGVAHLVGTVTGSDGAGVAGAEVTAYALQGTEWASVGTVTAGSDGAYDIGGLSGGVHTLGFRDPVSGVTEYWNDKATLAEADTVTVPTADHYDVTLATPLPPAPQPPTPSVTPSVTPTPPSVTPVATTTPVELMAAVASVKRGRIKGLAEVGRRLRLTTGMWSPSTVTLKVQWLANGKKIRTATTMRLKVTDKLVGKRISARIVASAPGHTSSSVTTKRTSRVVG
ncbi:carboxypeptidase-like regulatory domain-containing protein [Nocardioides KLBMP 9356]|uniref:alpha-amylase n=1 Tax=Nocardioides potassii TaxID=2911371 RepID=A0ABS9HE67_9ACTN|nr:carboxypeptidase-like regulatory domain-containing protein [Nocardioides potassii]MCF6379485.1 carboxypeptidase-like regulatory domain-containing protein [Nocardioides potassii]